MLRALFSSCLGLFALALCAPLAAAQPASADLSVVAFASVGAARVGLRSAAFDAGDEFGPAHELFNVPVGGSVSTSMDASVVRSQAMDLSVERTVAHALGVVAPTFSEVDRAALADTVVSPLDTLRMSRWERVWWGRGGLMRQVGLFPTHPDQPLDDLRQVAQVRRKMLKWHQTLGLVTVASMGTTVVAGQLAASGHGRGSTKRRSPSRSGCIPRPLRSRYSLRPSRSTSGGGGIDSITIHKWLAVGHVAGMLITPLLARRRRRAHYAMGLRHLRHFLHCHARRHPPAPMNTFSRAPVLAVLARRLRLRAAHRRRRAVRLPHRPRRQPVVYAMHHPAARLDGYEPPRGRDAHGRERARRRRARRRPRVSRSTAATAAATPTWRPTPRRTSIPT